MQKRFSWTLALILLAAAVVGWLALLPYTLALGGQSTISAQDAALGLAQAVVMYGLLVGLGLLLANAIGLGAPLLEAALRRQSTGEAVRATLPISILVGVVVALLVVGADRLVFQPAIMAEQGDRAAKLFATGVNAGPIKSFLASFYGGINEEIMLRLFFMSLLAWLGHFVSKTAEGKPTAAVLWIANILAALLFGLGHLSFTATLAALTPLVVTRGLLLNGLVGIVCGYLYMKRGLESAILGHFSADLVLHVIFGI
jgi:hypothetical protein